MYFKIVSYLAVLVLFTSCVDEKKEEKQLENKAKIVKVFDLKDSTSYQRDARYPALIYSLQDSTMAFEVSGKITKFYFDEGDFVKKGSTIAKLDDTIYKANYNSALATYKQSQLDYKRYKKLYESRSIAKRDFEQVKQSLDVNLSNLKIAKKNLEETKLKAEFDGVMAKKLVKDFERITAKQPIIRLQDNSAYKVKFFAPESDILEVEQKITEKSASEMVDFFVTVGKLEEKIPAKFVDISTTAEEISRTFEVTLKINSIKDKNIFPGMTAHVDVIEKKQKVQSIYIPLKAVFTNPKRESFVWLVDNENKVLKQKVETGKLINDSIEIKSGLVKDARVVTSGVRFLNENDEIKVYKKIGN